MAVAHGSAVGDTAFFSAGLEIECDVGYELVGARYLYCTVLDSATGVAYRGAPGRCEAVDCGLYAGLVNGAVAGSTRYGGVAAGLGRIVALHCRSCTLHQIH